MTTREAWKFLALACSIAGLGFLIVAALNLVLDRTVVATLFAGLAVLLVGAALLSVWQLRRLR